MSKEELKEKINELFENEYEYENEFFEVLRENRINIKRKKRFRLIIRGHIFYYEVERKNKCEHIRLCAIT